MQKMKTYEKLSDLLEKNSRLICVEKKAPNLYIIDKNIVLFDLTAKSDR